MIILFQFLTQEVFVYNSMLNPTLCNSFLSCGHCPSDSVVLTRLPLQVDVGPIVPCWVVPLDLPYNR